jgi:hypothetical protein
VTASQPVAPEYVRFIAQQRADGAIPDEPRVLAAGAVTESLHLDPDSAQRLLRVAALRAAGFFRPTKRTTIVWVDGNNQLAVTVAEMGIQLGDGLVVVVLPVRCDQEEGLARVSFVVGAPGSPRGLYAATEKLPRGPQLIVDVWGEALVAFAWQCLLGLVSGLAGAVGKDDRGNVLVPVEIEANSDGLSIVPMARHRFSGSSGLLSGVLR